MNSDEFISACQEAMKIKIVGCFLMRLACREIRDSEKRNCLIFFSEALTSFSQPILSCLTRAIAKTMFLDIGTNPKGETIVRNIVGHGGLRYSPKNMAAYDESAIISLKVGFKSDVDLRLESGKLLTVWNAATKIVNDPGEIYQGRLGRDLGQVIVISSGYFR